MVTAKFVGGPWDGQTKSYPRKCLAPTKVACYTDARAVGLFGIYSTLRTPDDPLNVVLHWKDLPKPSEEVLKEHDRRINQPRETGWFSTQI